MFPMKKVEAVECGGVCSPFEFPYPCGSQDCRCIPWGLFIGQCIYPIKSEHVMKMVEEHPNLCESHAECKMKRSGDFCARYPNSDIQYGWCFVSNFEAEAFFSKIGSNSEFAKGLLKMHAA